MHIFKRIIAIILLVLFLILLYLNYLIYDLTVQWNTLDYTDILLFIVLAGLLLLSHIFMLNVFRVTNQFKKISYGIIAALVIIPLFLLLPKLIDNTRFAHFRSNYWQSLPDKRVLMIDDFQKHHNLVGKTKNDVINILGVPTETEYFKEPNSIVYYLGPERGIFSIDSEWLVIDFNDSNKVVTVNIRTD